MSNTIESLRPAAQVAGALLVNSYLDFDGRCQEALDYYQQALGAEILSLMRFGDAPPADGCGPGPAMPSDKVMHASFRVGETVLMASDCFCENQPEFAGISLALTAADDAAAERMFAALAEGGAVRQPLLPTFFASLFGVVADRFGVCWMILANPRHG